MSKHRIICIAIPLTLLVAACGGSNVEEEAGSSQPEPAATTTSSTTNTTQTTMAAATTTSTMTTATTDEPDHQEGGDQVVDVIMSEFEFEPAVFEVVAGETVEFSITNVGAIEHEFRASNEHRIEEHMASGHGDHDEESDHHEEDGDVSIIVQPGETAHLMVTFSEDTTIYTEIACLLPGHYEAGMKAPIVYPDA